MSLKKRLSHDIFHARTDDRKLTQQQAADAVFISLREYQKIEKGDILPGTDIFLRLGYQRLSGGSKCPCIDTFLLKNFSFPLLLDITVLLVLPSSNIQKKAGNVKASFQMFPQIHLS